MRLVVIICLFFVLHVWASQGDRDEERDDLRQSSGDYQTIHPVLAAWWRGLNPDDHVRRRLKKFVNALLDDPYIHGQHKAFLITDELRDDGLILTVPLIFFAYRKAYDGKRFVRVIEYGHRKGESAARILGLALRILMAGNARNEYDGISDRSSDQKITLEQALKQMAEMQQDTAMSRLAFKAYKTLFHLFPKSGFAKTSNPSSERILVDALKLFNVALRPDLEMCKSKTENNQVRSLVFALKAASLDSRSDPCRMENVRYPNWLYDLSDVGRDDGSFKKNLLLDRAVCMLRNPITDDLDID